jgi:hypothetical protein
VACCFCFASHVAAHDLFDADVFKSKPFFSFIVTMHVLFLCRMCFFFLSRTASLLAIVAHLYLKLFPLWMRVKTLMTKNSTKRGTVVGWVTSTTNKAGLSKTKKVGFLSPSMEYALPSGEVIPRPADGF